MPFNKMLEWFKKEKELGIEMDYTVLATVSPDSMPHSRVVAIRKIENEHLVFFTQKGTRKVEDLQHNPASSMTFFLPMQQRQIILEGTARPLSKDENQQFWQTLSRERQLRFSSYASTSGQAIENLDQLEKRKKELSEQYAHQSIPMSEFYCGFRFTPEYFIFYSLGSISFSEVIKYSKNAKGWEQQPLSP
ncbi:pyridoxine/pyridoxamine 5'-phosphate oxidase [Legionella israelensis]|uniref:Pyridoxamine 5'-phosphate oxidase n=1 Tax=Legionella israelensis TaxID=454 RepID=A0A0W0W633_9GAMM|nr:pyridoxamine 5'-phosphate oxidase family protein [Legionella israelensis]KTD27815.1 pyridoxamine 5'-phosphate oxidase [Legionella israelensis]QBS10270.1 pyridoxamine 5'-phosphate oxidase [Legionella israelensis]SCY50758.1 pyridoxamine 5'-phosphate oxidase [Legionella israelensis DSM 19235]STX59867.1 Pyridoxamine 5'-phosphate oxidase (PNP/PMP oxidase) (PNPOx) [Legionella israelensis]